MKLLKLVFLPLMVSSSLVVLTSANADSNLDDYTEGADVEAQQNTFENLRDGAQSVTRESQQVWQDVKEESKELWRDTKSAFSEGVLEGKLQMAIALNKHLDVFDIEIDVEGNKAVLEGAVSSEVEKDLAGSIASGIEGIVSVDNRLIVDRSLTAKRNLESVNSKSEKRSFSQFVADVSTTASIKTELLASDDIKGFDVNVDTYKNRVTLTGEVKTEAQKNLAESIARKRDDVTEVVNKIRVNS